MSVSLVCNFALHWPSESILHMWKAEMCSCLHLTLSVVHTLACQIISYFVIYYYKIELLQSNRNSYKHCFRFHLYTELWLNIIFSLLNSISLMNCSCFSSSSKWLKFNKLKKKLHSFMKSIQITTKTFQTSWFDNRPNDFLGVVEFWHTKRMERFSTWYLYSVCDCVGFVFFAPLPLYDWVRMCVCVCVFVAYMFLIVCVYV